MEENIRSNRTCVVSYVGIERCDLLYYLIMLGKKFGRKILVIDNSQKKDLFALFEKNDEEDIIEMDDFIVVKDCIVSEEEIRDFDNVFIYAGIRTTGGHYELADEIILAPACDKTDIEYFRNQYPESWAMKKKVFLLLRDRANNKLSEKEAVKLLGVSASDTYSLPVDKSDISSYVSLSHTKKLGNLSYLSSDMRQVIKSGLFRYYQIPEKKIKKIIK